MQDYGRIMEDRARIVIIITIAIVIIFSFLGWSGLSDKVVSFLPLILVSIITTGICQVLIQRLTGDFLEKIPLTFKIGKIDISVSLFIMVTIILKLSLFRGI